MKQVFSSTFLAILGLAIAGGVTQAGVVLVEPGHVLIQHVDSAVPLDATQTLLNTACTEPDSNIESIGIDPGTGILYVQLAEFGVPSPDSCIFEVVPGPPGVVSLINPSTGFGITERGADLHFDPVTGLLVTVDQNWFLAAGQERIATVVPSSPGATGTYSLINPIGGHFGATFGMDFSAGAGGSDVPAGDVVFTADVGGNGLHSASFGGGGSLLHATPSGAGDDMVIQPSGDWVHVGDFTVPITAFSPVPPHAAAPSALDIQTIFTSAGLPYIYGSRATVCDTTGELYISYSGFPGGSGIFRVDEGLTTATHVLSIDGVCSPGDLNEGASCQDDLDCDDAEEGDMEGSCAREGLHDLTFGPSSGGAGNSVYFTVFDPSSAGQEVWEVSVPECPEGEVVAEGRMTGGGSVFDDSGARFTHGFELHCDGSLPNNLEVNWSGNRFHLESLGSIWCVDQAAISEGRPVAGFDTITGSGAGRMNGVAGATIQFWFTDAGEPGKGVDTARMTITPPAGPPVIVDNVLNRGNHQAHD